MKYKVTIALDKPVKGVDIVSACIESKYRVDNTFTLTLFGGCTPVVTVVTETVLGTILTKEITLCNGHDGCEPGYVCENSVCVTKCTKHLTDAGDCVECLNKEHCGPGQSCVQFQCQNDKVKANIIPKT